MSPIRAHSAGEKKHPETDTALAVAAVGIVYGDIGTSPLYALRESLHSAAHGRAVVASDVIGIVSLLLWLLIGIASFKYVWLILRADNRGEGGTLSLLALGVRALGGRKTWIMLLGIAGTALFFGDAFITPAISVLSAVEGVALVAPQMQPYIIPATLAILVTLFWFQRHGTEGISQFFAPVMLAWFALMAIMGLSHIYDSPQIVHALSPIPGLIYLLDQGTNALPVIGSVFLAITGAEALYADMGHFGRKPIRMAWTFVVFPSLALCYLGQGAMVIAHPETASDPFFLMAPNWALPLLVSFATAATVIASQAVITGAFSVAGQAVQLGLLPRLEIAHTSATQKGQIYMPRVNLILLACVIILVTTFGSSGSLASAYGIAVTGEMLITTILAAIVFRKLWNWDRVTVLMTVIPLAIVECLLLVANLTKVFEGGYVPLAVAVFLIAAMWTWVRGTTVMQEKSRAQSVPLDTLRNSLAKSQRLAHTQGIAIYLTAESVVAPPALLHNLKHNGVLHAHNYIVTVRTANRPHIALEHVCEVDKIDDHFSRVRLTFGYMDEPNVPIALRQKVKFDIMNTSFFLNRRTIKAGDRKGLYGWQKRLFVAMHKTASTANDYYHLPGNRVVELGQQVTI